MSSNLSQTSEWRNWKTKEWSYELFRLVFLDESRLQIPVTRIDTTERFLVLCTGDHDAEPTAVRQAFLGSFGKTSQEISEHYKHLDHDKARSKAFGFPSNFAALYLTLLAASADEKTHAFGDFRERFVNLFLPLKITVPDFQSLPEHWEYLESWVNARHKAGAKCRVLILPDPAQHERLIGRSKRLAFPSYKDELELQKIIQTAGLSEGSGFKAFCNEVSKKINSFSENFKQELSIFTKLVHRGDNLSAYSSPMWGALLDITWELEVKDICKNGAYKVNVDVNDPMNPTLHLHADKSGGKFLDSTCKSEENFSLEKLSLTLRRRDGEKWNPHNLLALTTKSKQFQRSKVAKSLTNGGLAFFPDKYGILCTAGTFVEGSSICFLLDQRNSRELERDLTSYNIKVSFITSLAPTRDWKLFTFLEIFSSTYEFLVRRIQAFSKLGLATGWRPKRPNITRAVWYGQTLFLNPASSPLIQMNEAVSGNYELIDKSGAVIKGGKLLFTEGFFQINPQDLISLNDAQNVCFYLDTSHGSRRETLSVPVILEVPLDSPKALPNKEDWQIDGHAGKLIKLAQHLKSRPTVDKGRINTTFTHFIKLEINNSPNDKTFTLDEFKSQNNPIHWLIEALMLRYQQRTTLPYTDLEYLELNAAIAANYPQWKIHRVLMNSCLIYRLQRTGTQFAYFTPGSRTMSVLQNESSKKVRIAGMISSSEFNNLKRLLPTESQIRYLKNPNNGIAVGALEFEVYTKYDLAQIQSLLGMTLLERENYASPIDQIHSFSSELVTQHARRNSSNANRRWDTRNGRWGTCTNEHDTRDEVSLLEYIDTYLSSYVVQNKEVYWKTDSESWGRLLFLALNGTPMGRILPNGNCEIHPMIRRLPPSLCQWWMHWGGGVITLSKEGNIVLAGDYTINEWKLNFTDFLVNLTPASLANGSSLQKRRKLALSLRRAKKERYFF